MIRFMEIVRTPANYTRFLFSRFPERRRPIIVASLLTFACALARMLSGLRRFEIAADLSFAALLSLLLF